MLRIPYQRLKYFYLQCAKIMLAYELVYSRDAVRSLRKIPSKLAKRICSKLEELVKDPYAKNNNIKPLQWSEANYRLRIGDWRVIYILDNDKNQVIIVDVDSRGEIYNDEYPNY